MAKTVLIVEDNELNMKLFRGSSGSSWLRNDRHQQRLRGTRSRAQAASQSGFDGYSAAAGFRARRDPLIKDDPELRAIPVVAVTAFAMKGDEERIREGGCEAYLSKPISVGKFIETVRRFIG